jgi:hypothetical protein
LLGTVNTDVKFLVWVSRLFFSVLLYLQDMFIRKKPNQSGSISVQIIQKNKGKYIVLKTIGSSKDLIEIEFLVQKAQKQINEFEKTIELPFFAKQELEFVDSFVDYIDILICFNNYDYVYLSDNFRYYELSSKFNR